MATTPTKSAKPATKRAGTAAPVATQAKAKRSPQSATAIRTGNLTAKTPEQAAQAIDQALQGKLGHNKVRKATKAALKFNNDNKVNSVEGNKGTPKRGAETQKQPKIVKSAQKHAKTPRKDSSPSAQPTPLGPPCTFTAAIAEEIGRRMSLGEPLANICRDDNMPAVRTVNDWRTKYPEFGANIARAREEGFDFIAADTMKIIDTKPERCLTADGDKVDSGHVAWLKNRVEQRLKLLAKWDPKRYGDKMDINHGGQEGNPVEVRTKVVVVPSKVTAEVLSRVLPKDGEQ